jgi:shikimate dehydrogenase
VLQCGVFGHPLKHSISAVFQQAAFDELGIAATYESWEVRQEDFPARVAALRDPEFLGANVTIPHKQAALVLVDVAHPLAVAVGTVNTIVRRDRALAGYNTDVVGFLRSVRVDGRCDPQGLHVLLLGAGGAARAIALALVLAGAQRLTVANRHADRAKGLIAHLRTLEPSQKVHLRSYLHERLPALTLSHTVTTLDIVEWHTGGFLDAAGSADLVVNCTSAGMFGDQQEMSPLPANCTIRRGALLVDIVANPMTTTLMRQCAGAGMRVVGGLPMLVYQGAESFEMWTGRIAPIEVMLEKARTHMARIA